MWIELPVVNGKWLSVLWLRLRADWQEDWAKCRLCGFVVKIWWIDMEDFAKTLYPIGTDILEYYRKSVPSFL